MANTFTALSVVIAVLSLGLLLGLIRTLKLAVRTFPVPAAIVPAPAITVIIPARNEEQDLRDCVQSILNQRGVDVRILIVNDHSTDRTGEIADQLAAAEDRVHVLHDPPVQPGWLGKINALHQGLSLERGDLIVFSDADIRHAPDCFAIAHREMMLQQLDLISFAPRFEHVSFWENALMPHVMIAGTLQFFHPGINDPSTNDAAAAGAMIMFRRAALEASGGLKEIRNEFLDDLELARLLKTNGFRTQMWVAPELLSVRLFKSNRGAFVGLTKNILGAVDHLWLAFPAMFLPVFVYWVPIVTCVLGATSGNWLMILSGCSAWLIQASLLIPVQRICRIHFGKALAFPLGALPVLYCFTLALYHRCVSGSVSWRGRIISVRKADEYAPGSDIR